MSEFTDDEILELEDYVTNQLTDMLHLHIEELSFNNDINKIQNHTCLYE